MHFNSVIPELSVTDCERSLRFYRDILGFSIAYQRKEEGFAFLEYERAQLMLDQINRGRTFENINVLVEKPLGLGINLQIEVSSIDSLHDALHKARVKLRLPLENKLYLCGQEQLCNRQFIVADPDGYLLRFYTPIGSGAISSKL